MPAIRFEGVTLTYPGNDRPAIDHLDLEIHDGEFLVVVGPSGCGKTTALRTLAGLEEVDSGRVFIGDQDVTDLPPKARNIAMVFQNYALYPHMTVAQNMAFALRIAHMPKAEIAERVERAAELLDLTVLLKRRPAALSGGQRQRVAMGRAIVREPLAFLMDEPLSNLDAKLRVQTRTQIAELQRRLGITTMYVTHDQIEAMTMGDRVAVIRDGVLQQLDTPQAIYAAPINTFVAGFVGSPPMNLLTLPIAEGGDVAFGASVLHPPEAVRKAVDAAGGTSVVVGIRPERWRRCSEEEGVSLQVAVVEELGADSYVHGTVEIDGEKAPIVIRQEEGPPPAKGSVIRIAPIVEQLHYFSPENGERLAQ